MIQNPQLRIPGPTPIPARVQQAMDAPMINHRGPEFRALLPELEAGLRWAFQTDNEMLIFPATGTGGMESAVANLVSPGERVLAVTIGAFGDRFADLAAAFGADVARYTLPWGEAADPEDLDDLLSREPDIATVLITHNETSTGVTNRLQSLAELDRVDRSTGRSLGRRRRHHRVAEGVDGPAGRHHGQCQPRGLAATGQRPFATVLLRLDAGPNDAGQGDDLYDTGGQHFLWPSGSADDDA